MVSYNLQNKQVGIPFLHRPASNLMASATNCFNNLSDCVDHQLWLLLVDFVAAIRLGDVLCVRRKLGEAFLCLFLCGIGDVTKVWWNILW